MYKAARIWPLLLLVCALAACSGGHSGGAPAPATISLSGAVVDGPVGGATVSAYTISSAGVVSSTAIATTTTTATGSYTLTLPAGTTGPLLIVSTGGSYTDDVTGQTVSAPPLSAIVPSIASGATSVVAQLTPLTTVAAQAALAGANAANPVATLASSINSLLSSYFGGQGNILLTPLVDVSSAACASAANQASVDASLIMAGIAQLASANNVTTAQLVQALVADYESDNVFDGTASGVALTVPLNGGAVQLCAIENDCAGTASPSGLAQQLNAAITAFQGSAANVCRATQSTGQAQVLATPPQLPPPPSKYTYTLNSTLSGYAGAESVTVRMQVGLKCPDDSGALSGANAVGGNGSFAVVARSNGPSDVNNDAGAVITAGPAPLNDCGSNSWSVTLKTPPDLSCSFSGPTSGTFTSSDGGYTNTASGPSVNCNALYTVGGTITGLTAGTLELEDNGGDDLMLGAGATSFTFATPLAAGAQYNVTVAAQPTGLTCSVQPSMPQTMGTSNVTNVAVSCSPNSSGGGGGGSSPTPQTVYVVDSTHTLFAFDSQGNKLASAALPGQAASIGNLNGGGITVDASNVYVTLGAPSTGVAAFSRTTLQPVTLASGAFSNLNTPRGIVFDPANSQFYVANGGSTVTIYNATGGYLTSVNQTGAGIYGPSGIAYDPLDNAIWVANYTGGGSSTNPTYGIAEFSPSGTIVQNYPTANTNPPTPFAPPVNTGHEMPYTIAYCGNALAVGFISDGSNSGSSEGGGYSTAGASLGSGYAGPITNLHAMACASNGNVYVAADNGLLEYANATGTSVALPSGGFAGLTPPIYGVGVGTASGLSSPQGLVYANGSLYVASSGNNQVLIYSVQTSNTSQLVTGMTLTGTITADLDDPVRLAMDGSGHLFVANLANSTITVYDTTNNNAEITAAGSKPLISGGSLNRPLGVAVDSKGNVYVANNGGNSISVFQPVTTGNPAAGYTEASFSPLSADAQGNSFLAPGVLYDAQIAGQDYLLVGIGPTSSANHVYLYQAPFSGEPPLVYDLSSVTNGTTCATMPTGPTGIAVYANLSAPATSQLFIASYYNNLVAEYTAAQFIGATGTCATPAVTTGSAGQVSAPEGVAVDTLGNNVFVANSGSNTITVYALGASFGGGPVFTLHN